jgi:D-xylonolactonase
MNDSRAMPHEVRLVTPATRAILGEGPVWDERTETLYWVDIDRGELHQCRADGSKLESTKIGRRVCCVALRRRESGFVAGLERSVALITLNPLTIRPLLDIPAPVDTPASAETPPVGRSPTYRCNDGKCDSAGRFWFGTYTEAATRACDWFFRFDAAGALTRAAGPVACANGPAFSPDGKIAYFVDTYGKVVYRYDVMPSGELSGQRIFKRFDAEGCGFPDGLTSDASGCVWIAEWGGSRVSRFSPEGDLLEVIRLPVAQPTSCTFGGPGLKRLFITSASQGLDAASNANGLAGALFAVDLEVGGAPAARFDG